MKASIIFFVLGVVQSLKMNMNDDAQANRDNRPYMWLCNSWCGNGDTTGTNWDTNRAGNVLLGSGGTAQDCHRECDKKANCKCAEVKQAGGDVNCYMFLDKAGDYSECKTDPADSDPGASTQQWSAWLKMPSGWTPPPVQLGADLSPYMLSPTYDTPCTSPITTREACQAAATEIGINWDGDRNWADRLPGCLTNLPGYPSWRSDVNWNTNTGGTAQLPDGQILLCNKVSGNGGGHAGGDPHLTNVAGQKFNIQRTGYAELLKIPGQGEQLKILGLIEGAKACAKKTWISKLNMTGSWLEKRIAIDAAAENEERISFSLTIDEQQVWTPSIDQKASLNKNIVFKHEAGKFFIRELDSKETDARQPGVQIHLASVPNLILKVTRPMLRSSVSPHLNLNVHGLSSPGILSVGGLLGSDDHSDWSTTPSECKSFQRIAHFESEEDPTGSVAAW